jgi:hypothetical protein
MSSIGPIMGYILAFLLLGAFFNYIPLSKEVFVPFISIISLGTALFSFTYYTSSTTFTNYIIISLSLPFFAVFWSLVKIIPPKKPIFRTNLIIGLYIIIYLPVIALVLSIYNIFTADESISSTLNYIFISIILVSLLVLLLGFIIL